MGKLILVDACKTSLTTITAVNMLRTQAQSCQLHVFGVAPGLNLWERHAHLRDGDRTVRPKTRTKGATKITLTAEAMRLSAGKEAGWEWTLIGNDRAYIELTKTLTELGVDVDYYATLCPEEAQAMIGHQPALAQKMRQLFVEMQNGRNIHVPVGRFADMAVRRFPELRDRPRRTEMFGAAKFPRIVKNIGMRVSGNDIIGLD